MSLILENDDLAVGKRNCLLPTEDCLRVSGHSMPDFKICIRDKRKTKSPAKVTFVSKEIINEAASDPVLLD